MRKEFEIESYKLANSIDDARKRSILLFVSYITGSVMLVYGILHLFNQNHLLLLILFGCSAVFYGNALFYHLTHRLNDACELESILVGTFVLALVYQGGHENTALYWVFPFPAILFGLLGVRKALIMNILLLILLSIMLYVPDLVKAQYAEAEKSRFLVSLLLVIIVSLINDFFRERSHMAMSQVQRSREKQANTDILTRLVNRRFITVSLPKYLNQNPENFLPLGVIMCDLDHFKTLNDTHGHECGDLALKHVAQLFIEHLRQQDIACRSGGEEFLFLLPLCGIIDALHVAEKVREALVDTDFSYQGQHIPLTASFGVSLCKVSDGLDAAIKVADLKMYEAKQAGRNCVR